MGSGVVCLETKASTETNLSDDRLPTQIRFSWVGRDGGGGGGARAPHAEGAQVKKTLKQRTLNVLIHALPPFTDPPMTALLKSYLRA